MELPLDTNIETNGRPQRVITDASVFKSMGRFEAAINRLRI